MSESVPLLEPEEHEGTAYLLLLCLLVGGEVCVSLCELVWAQADHGSVAKR